jgi:tetratricopeptide (TPR) repeat protein
MELWLALVLAAAAVGPLDRALALEAQGDDAAALAAATEATRAAPTSALAHLEAGRLAMKTGALDQAKLELWVAHALAPENPRVQFLLGSLEAETGQPWRAAAAMERAVEYRQDYFEAHRALGALYLSLQDPFRAELHLRAALEAKPDETLLSLQLADALEAQGRPKDAEAQLRALHERVPVSALVTRRLVDFLRRQGRAREADALERPLAQPPRTLRPLRPSRR